MSEEASKAIVIDTGSGYCKAGMAADESPACCFPTLYTQVMNMEENIEHIVGFKARDAKGKLPVVQPIERGLCSDWNALEHVWQHCFLHQLKLDSTEHPVLTSYYCDDSKVDKENTAMIFFETFAVPGYYCLNGSLLALYGSGKTSGLIVDSGEEVSSVVPIMDGFVIPHAHSRADFGGRDITKKLDNMLKSRAINVGSEENARLIKEQRGYISMEYEKELERYQKGFSKPANHRLPDGTFIQIGEEAVTAVEALFNPTMVGSTEPGLSGLIAESIQKVDIEARKELLSNVILAGGNTLFKYLSAR